VYEGAAPLFAEQLNDCARHIERSAQVNLDNRIPVGFPHLVEHAIAQDAGRIDNCIDAAEAVERLGNHSLNGTVTRYALAIPDRLTATRLNLPNNPFGGFNRIVTPS